MNHAACRSCGAPIVWAEAVATGRVMPVDAEPAPDGTLELLEPIAPLAPERYRILTGFDLELAAGRPLHRSHFATCPNAGAHRKRP